jgi:hypothetical protein
MAASAAMRIAGSASLPTLVVLFFDGMEAVASALDIDGGPRALVVALAGFVLAWLPAIVVLRPLRQPWKPGLAAGALVAGAMAVVVAGAAAMHGADVVVILVPFAALALACGGAAGWLAGRV